MRVFVAELGDAELREFGSHEIAAATACAFNLGMVDGLFHLITTQIGSRLPAKLSFLREFTKAIYTHWILAHRATGATLGAAPPGMLEAWAALSSAPGSSSMARRRSRSASGSSPNSSGMTGRPSWS